MQVRKILITILIILSVSFLGLQVLQFETQASALRALLLIVLTVFYYLTIKDKKRFFYLFLVSFTIAEILNFTSMFVSFVSENGADYSYYLTNALYILSYIFLIIKVLGDMNLKEIIRKFPIHIIVLLVLDVFCVITVTETTKGLLSNAEYALEFSYNTIIMLLLTITLINYIYREDKKSMNLLIGSIFIVFSEVIQLAYFYISAINILNVICSFFLVMAFIFFYLQSRLIYQKNDDLTSNELYI
jgi:cbb3-type cytochrome oxidase subunit 3